VSRAAARAGLVLFLGCLAACGYSTGIRVKDRVGGVGITVFGNKTLEPDLERDFQDEFSRAIRSYTDAHIQPPETAEILVRGTVLHYQRRGGIRSSDNELLETGVFVETEAGLYDRRTDRALGPQRTARVWIGFVLDEFEGEASARARAIRFVTEQLVLELFAPLE